MEKLINIAKQFSQGAEIINVQPFGSGNINDTFLVTTDDISPHFVLQRINTEVFCHPELVMQNMGIVTRHMQKRLDISPLINRRWEIPKVIFTNNNQDHLTVDGVDYWRSISYIPNSYSIDVLDNHHQGEEIGAGLGIFHNLISDLSPQQLADTLPGFHITPQYFTHYQKVLSNHTVPPSIEGDFCLNFISDRTQFVTVLEDALKDGKLPLRLMHGDPKVNNIMLDQQTGKSVSVIDLDTVKPGLIHYDLGDCLRSGCNPLGEEAKNWQMVYFDVDLCQAILAGYLQEARSFFTSYDYDYIYPAIALISFELGLRFFTDYLAQNVYFKVKYPKHNLDRALVQFKLTESIEKQQNSIVNIVNDLRSQYHK